MLANLNQVKTKCRTSFVSPKTDGNLVSKYATKTHTTLA